MTKKFRPVAVPLINVDPYFSVWFMGDKLTDDFTRHWTGIRQAMTGILVIDGIPYRFMGRTSMNSKHYVTEHPPMEQVSVTVNALTTDYVFEAAGVQLTLTFMTPGFMDDLDMLSRPVCFLRFVLRSTDGKEHQTKLYFDASGEFTVNEDDAEVTIRKNTAETFEEMVVGGVKQDVLGQKGDTVTINWGYLHLACEKDSGFTLGTWNDDARYDHFRWTREQKDTCSFLIWFYYHSGEYAEGEPIKFNESHPMLLAHATQTVCPDKDTVLKLCLAYDDVKAINYFGKQTDAYWRRNGATFDEILADSFANFDTYIARAEALSADIYRTAEAAGGKKYADLLALAYRQAINAHKLIADEKGQAVWLSKECNSNGCIGTVDVSYPSMPIFLCFNPELVFGMMRPVLRYAKSDAWPWDFAPHDVGVYPNAVGQIYSGTDAGGQMMIEESGNMILMTAAATKACGDLTFFRENKELLGTWCKYLTENSLDPANQLCTDDFTGHLAHNANLAIKGISAVAAFGVLCGMDGDKEEEKRLTDIARHMAKEWEKLAMDEDGQKYKLAYDRPGSWSLKYNIVWDKLMGMNVFDKGVYEKESAFYLTKLNKYGVPLDSRADFTKVDFLMWSAMIGDEEFAQKIIDSIWNFVNDTNQRYAFTDWYDTILAKRQYFINRSVIGGLFIKYLDYLGKVKL